jgi:hypothetical protein
VLSDSSFCTPLARICCVPSRRIPLNFPDAYKLVLHTRSCLSFLPDSAVRDGPSDTGTSPPPISTKNHSASTSSTCSLRIIVAFLRGNDVRTSTYGVYEEAAPRTETHAGNHYRPSCSSADLSVPSSAGSSIEIPVAVEVLVCLVLLMEWVTQRWPCGSEGSQLAQ